MQVIFGHPELVPTSKTATLFPARALLWLLVEETLFRFLIEEALQEETVLLVKADAFLQAQAVLRLVVVKPCYR
jgi:hypothetical protein